MNEQEVKVDMDAGVASQLLDLSGNVSSMNTFEENVVSKKTFTYHSPHYDKPIEAEEYIVRWNRRDGQGNIVKFYKMIVCRAPMKKIVVDDEPSPLFHIDLGLEYTIKEEEEARGNCRNAFADHWGKSKEDRSFQMRLASSPKV